MVAGASCVKWKQGAPGSNAGSPCVGQRLVESCARAGWPAIAALNALIMATGEVSPDWIKVVYCSCVSTISLP